MIRFVFGAILIMLLLPGCSEQEKVSPTSELFPADSILSRDRMISLLTDVQIIEGALVLHRNRGLSTSDDAGLYYAALFHKYRISRRCYLENIKYYQEDPEDFVKMYDVVVQRITNRQQNYDPKLWSKFGINSGRID
jgi:hypothetical protein